MKYILTLIPIFIIGSWIGNVIKITNCDFEPNYECEVIHLAGLVPGVSLITVWIDSDE